MTRLLVGLLAWPVPTPGPVPGDARPCWLSPALELAYVGPGEKPGAAVVRVPGGQTFTVPRAFLAN